MTSHLLSKPTSCHSQLQWIVQGCNLDLFFFFNDTATTEIYPLSLHDALPICLLLRCRLLRCHTMRAFRGESGAGTLLRAPPPRHTPRLQGTAKGPGNARPAPGLHPARPRNGRDRKSTRLNSSHANISYAVFCL